VRVETISIRVEKT